MEKPFNYPKIILVTACNGGPKGWQYQVYEANQLNDSTMTLTMKSPDGDANFPGNVTATVTYALTRDNAIDINYEATTDKKTVINMTNHSYFNLSGNPANPATDHILYVNADSITPVDSTFMTTGEMMAVTETPFDFNTPKTIAPDVTNFENEQIKFGNGFDHNWVLNTKGDINQLAAKLTSDLYESYSFLRLEELSICFELGVKEEFGDYVGLNYRTFCKWLKGYKMSDFRYRVIKQMEQRKKCQIFAFCEPRIQ